MEALELTWKLRVSSAEIGRKESWDNSGEIRLYKKMVE